MRAKAKLNSIQTHSFEKRKKEPTGKQVKTKYSNEAGKKSLSKGDWKKSLKKKDTKKRTDKDSEN